MRPCRQSGAVPRGNAVSPPEAVRHTPVRVADHVVQHHESLELPSKAALRPGGEQLRGLQQHGRVLRLPDEELERPDLGRQLEVLRRRRMGAAPATMWLIQLLMCSIIALGIMNPSST